MALSTTYYWPPYSNDRSRLDGTDVIAIAPNERDLAQLAEAGERGELTALFNRRAGGIVGYAVRGEHGDKLVTTARNARDVHTYAEKTLEHLTTAAKRIGELRAEMHSAIALGGTVSSHPSDAKELLDDLLSRIGDAIESGIVTAEVCATDAEHVR